ncbi:CHAT domain-containing protein [Terasakiella sp. A23]|uniref:CHAT domain-containing protein n=1 Tax=Terasakiella sp. FCG-A23 TaxID=3080561 RepID=UPI0029541670|nr:CHAT domain-containing protein [Terasakiella sp. A23]MDV7340396.1 CHAT domain-containing protein [Terasakiella sp. A23]
MKAQISINGKNIICQCEGEAPYRIPLDDACLQQMADWNERYSDIVKSENNNLLLMLGQEIFDWLNHGKWASGWLSKTGNRELEIRTEIVNSPQAKALLDLPWEILATDNMYLAANEVQRFKPYRRIGTDAQTAPFEPRYQDLTMTFMAAAPTGQNELDYEAEEVAILNATEQLDVYVSVEESGCLEFLKPHLAQQGPFDVVHFSCHGDIDKDGNPFLCLESPEGDEKDASVGDIIDTLGENMPPLVFLSACKTAAKANTEGAEFSEPFARHLIQAGVANVIGWDGSVYDSDAKFFAEKLYHELGEYHSISYAMAIARLETLRKNQRDPQTGKHWHLARLYTGTAGGGALCQAGKDIRGLKKEAGYTEFLDKVENNVPVANAREFVGRRRDAQKVLSAFRAGKNAGTLVQGMGNLGKSSLAARIANRLPQLNTVVIYGDYDASSVFERLIKALPVEDKKKFRSCWEEQIATDPTVLADALEAMLTGPFLNNPILLIIDDLEQILEDPKPNQKITPVKDADDRLNLYRDTLGAILTAFADYKKKSRLLLTSRYTFTLPDRRGRDLASKLNTIALRPMEGRQQQKQWQAARRNQEKPVALDEAAHDLIQKACETAEGNPGLQQILTQPIFSGDAETAENAINAVESWKASGEIPEDESAAQDFFERLSFETYLNALTKDQHELLRAIKLFTVGIPVPLTAIQALGDCLNLEDHDAVVQRLMGLGLLDNWGTFDGYDCASINPLASPLAQPELTEEEINKLSASVIEPLASAWRDEDGDIHHDPRGLDLARVALAGGAPCDIINSAVCAGGQYLFWKLHDANTALSLVQQALEIIANQNGAPEPDLILVASNCAERVGEWSLRTKLLEQGLNLQSKDKKTLAQVLVLFADSTLQRDGPQQTLEKFEQAITLFDELDDLRSKAVTMGKIANIYQRQGHIDEALRIRWEEQLPVYEQLGDIREKAIAMGGIADIYQQQGNIDEALRIRHEEELPVYEQLGDVKSKAVTMGQIADILLQQGNIDEALHIRHEEELSVYERLGDVSSKAVTMGQIADIFQKQGNICEALRIRREEQLPVYEQLGDIRSKAVTMGKIADIYHEQGNVDEALRIQSEEVLPVLREVEDRQNIAYLLLFITRIRLNGDGLEKGQASIILDELSESFQLFLQFKQPDGIAITGTLLGHVYASVGYFDEALKVFEISKAAAGKINMTDRIKQITELEKAVQHAKQKQAEEEE